MTKSKIIMIFSILSIVVGFGIFATFLWVDTLADNSNSIDPTIKTAEKIPNGTDYYVNIIDKTSVMAEP